MYKHTRNPSVIIRYGVVVIQLIRELCLYIALFPSSFSHYTIYVFSSYTDRTGKVRYPYLIIFLHASNTTRFPYSLDRLNAINDSLQKKNSTIGYRQRKSLTHARRTTGPHHSCSFSCPFGFPLAVLWILSAGVVVIPFTSFSSCPLTKESSRKSQSQMCCNPSGR